MSMMAWYPLQLSGSTASAGDEFFENQTAGWSLWSFSSADGHSAAKHGSGAGRSDEQTDGSPPLVPQQCPRSTPTDDIFMSQFSDEEVRKMDAPFEALDMFPDSMHRLLSYENMMLGSPEHQDVKLDQNGVDAMDTCGFPLFSHDLQSGSTSSPETLPVPDLTPKDQAAVSMTKRRRSVAGEEKEQSLEALVLEELEDAVLQLTKRTRICFRDAFSRLAESSRANRSAANGAPGVGSSNQAEGTTSSRISAPGCPERETNVIDRTVAYLTIAPPCPAPPQVHMNRYSGNSGEEVQSTTSWTTVA